MESTNKLSKEEIENLALFLECFKRAYYLQTYKKLETVEQILEVVKAGVFTFEDVFMTYLDQCLSHGSDEDDIFWEDNMDMFDCVNYFPSFSESNKKIKDGAWIKIRTENGFEIHFAKKSNRKRRFQEEYEAACRQRSKFMNKRIEDLNNPNKKYSEIATPENEAKQKTFDDKITELGIRMLIGLPLYEVKINRTKSKAEYYLPYQYEIVDNVEEFADAYMDNITGVNIKTLYTSENKDAVFYLRSRGISQKAAEMMAALKQTYFKVNMVDAINEYNRQWNSSVRLVEA